MHSPCPWPAGTQFEGLEADATGRSPPQPLGLGEAQPLEEAFEMHMADGSIAAARRNQRLVRKVHVAADAALVLRVREIIVVGSH